MDSGPFRLGRVLGVGIGVAEWAGPYVVAVGGSAVDPAGQVADVVVVGAAWGVVWLRCWAALGVGHDVVDVARGGGRPAAFRHAGRMVHFDASPEAGGRSAPGDSVVDDVAGFGVGDPVAPLLTVAVLGDPAGDVSDDRTVSGKFSRMFGESGERFEIDVDVYDAFLA